MRIIEPVLLGDHVRDIPGRQPLRNSVDAVIRYHQETKHHFHHYARSLGYLDWANQPNPFRLYNGLTPGKLPFATKDPHASYVDLYERTRNRFEVDPDFWTVQ